MVFIFSFFCLPTGGPFFLNPVWETYNQVGMEAPLLWDEVGQVWGISVNFAQKPVPTLGNFEL